MYTLSHYIAEKFPILKHCWCIPCLITLLRCSQSWNIADVYLVSLHCWKVPNLKTLLMYNLCYYMAELYPILLHCRTMIYLIHCCRLSRNFVGSQSESSITSPKSPHSCRLGWRFLCSMISYSESSVNVTRRGIRQQCFKIGNISAM